MAPAICQTLNQCLREEELNPNRMRNVIISHYIKHSGEGHRGQRLPEGDEADDYYYTEFSVEAGKTLPALLTDRIKPD